MVRFRTALQYLTLCMAVTLYYSILSLGCLSTKVHTANRVAILHALFLAGGPILYNASSGADSCHELLENAPCPGFDTQGAAALGINCTVSCSPTSTLGESLRFNLDYLCNRVCLSYCYDLLVEPAVCRVRDVMKPQHSRNALRYRCRRRVD